MFTPTAPEEGLHWSSLYSLRVRVAVSCLDTTEANSGHSVVDSVDSRLNREYHFYIVIKLNYVSERSKQVLLLNGNEKQFSFVSGCVTAIAWIDFNEIFHTDSSEQNLGRV